MLVLLFGGRLNLFRFYVVYPTVTKNESKKILLKPKYIFNGLFYFPEV